MSASVEARIVAALEPIAPTWNAVKEDSKRNPALEPDTYFTYTVIVCIGVAPRVDRIGEIRIRLKRGVS